MTRSFRRCFVCSPVFDYPVNREWSRSRNFLHAQLFETGIKYLPMNDSRVALVIVPFESREPTAETIQQAFRRKTDQQGAARFQSVPEERESVVQRCDVLEYLRRDYRVNSCAALYPPQPHKRAVVSVTGQDYWDRSEP